MLIEIPLNDLTKIYKLATLGKVIGGLIHNLNGPLQNLGLDIEMTNHLLNNKLPLDNDEIKNILNRLKRMGEEFEKIDQLIKASSIKAGPDEYYHFLHINEFLQKELMFKKHNLYYKHNVHTELKLQNNMPTFNNLPKNVIMGLSWFLQAIIEELEYQQIKELSVKTSLNEQLEILIETKEGMLSDKFMEQLSQDLPELQSVNVKGAYLEVTLPLLLFKASGVSISGIKQTNGSKIIINIPINNLPA